MLTFVIIEIIIENIAFVIIEIIIENIHTLIYNSRLPICVVVNIENITYAQCVSPWRPCIYVWRNRWEYQFSY